MVQANEIGCHVITLTDDLLAKLPLLGKSLEAPVHALRPGEVRFEGCDRDGEQSHGFLCDHASQLRRAGAFRMHRARSCFETNANL